MKMAKYLPASHPIENIRNEMPTPLESNRKTTAYLSSAKISPEVHVCNANHSVPLRQLYK